MYRLAKRCGLSGPALTLEAEYWARSEADMFEPSPFGVSRISSRQERAGNIGAAAASRTRCGDLGGDAMEPVGEAGGFEMAALNVGSGEEARVRAAAERARSLFAAMAVMRRCELMRRGAESEELA